MSRVKMSVRCLSPLFVSMFVSMFVLIGAVPDTTDLKRKVGDEVSFKPNPTLSSGNTITWKFSSAGGVFRVIELDHGQSGFPQNPLFKDNAAADKTTGELTLKNLRKEHSGLYTFEINGKEQVQKFTLMVMGVVLKPKINQEKSSNHDFVYLTCEYNKTINENAKMSWNCSNVKQNQTTGDSFAYSKTGKADSCCTCTLKNDVSEETSDQICETKMFPGESNTVVIVLWTLFTFIVIGFIIVLFWLLYKHNNNVHNWIYSNCKDKPCLGGMVEMLERSRSKKDRQREEDDKSNSEPLKKTDKGAGDEGPGDKSPVDE